MLDLSRNHFDLLGLPIAYPIDQERLAERYHDLQRRLHPDRFAASGDRERRLAVQAASQVNEAYQTLRDPLRRARYLLELMTGAVDASAGAGDDPGFLMTQMELREALAEVRDRPDPQAEVEAILDRLAHQSAGIVEGLTARFERASPADLAEAGGLVRQFQFLAKCRAEAERLVAELDEGSAG